MVRIRRQAAVTAAVACGALAAMSFSVPASADGSGSPGPVDRFAAVRQSVTTRAPSAALLAQARSREGAASAVSRGGLPSVTTLGQISADGLPPAHGAGANTQAEPDIAINPANPLQIEAVVQEGRFPTLGGAQDNGYAWTHDGGRSWHHGNLPGLTTSVGGPFDRASDVVVAWAPDGSVYAQSLLVDVPLPDGSNRNTCRTSVGVQRSVDGGRSFGPLMLVQDDRSCRVFNDKNWITVDTRPHSPHYGRIYSVWDRSTPTGGPQVLRYSDDHGRSWSRLITISAPTSGTSGAQPVVLNDGTLLDVYEAGTSQSLLIRAQRSTDGGVHFSRPVDVAVDLASMSPDFRDGADLPNVTVDRSTGRVFTVWSDQRFRRDGDNDVVLTSSADGAHWSRVQRVTTGPTADGLDHFMAAVAAADGHLWVSYRTRDYLPTPSNLVGMDVVTSANGGRTFSAPLRLGPTSDLRYTSPTDRGLFLGDYMGIDAVPGRAAAVWDIALHPSAGQSYRQTTWAATLRP